MQPCPVSERARLSGAGARRAAGLPAGPTYAGTDPCTRRAWRARARGMTNGSSSRGTSGAFPSMPRMTSGSPVLHDHPEDQRQLVLGLGRHAVLPELAPLRRGQGAGRERQDVLLLGREVFHQQGVQPTTISRVSTPGAAGLIGAPVGRDARPDPPDLGTVAASAQVVKAIAGDIFWHDPPGARSNGGTESPFLRAGGCVGAGEGDRSGRQRPRDSAATAAGAAGWLSASACGRTPVCVCASGRSSVPPGVWQSFCGWCVTSRLRARWRCKRRIPCSDRRGA